MGNDILAIVVITICTAAASAGLGLVLVTLFTSRGKFEGVATVVILILTAFSGSFVPRFVMGDFIQKASLFIPQSWALIAYQDIMVRSKTLVDVLPHCGILLVFAAVFFLFGVWRFKFE
jgi:ABC-2 type transport system permease protein